MISKHIKNQLFLQYHHIKMINSFNFIHTQNKNTCNKINKINYEKFFNDISNIFMKYQSNQIILEYKNLLKN